MEFHNYQFYDDNNRCIVTEDFNKKKSSIPIAVQIKNVCLNYGSDTILNGINMNVPVKKIYGLLGPSGCGKTSLLRCMIGIRKPDSGTILVYGYKPGTANIPGPGLGYMPQEVALFADFTIEETFEYFGKLFHMKSNDVQNRTNYLIGLLNLPEKDFYIKNLSGGQKRRVSLAVALIHSPSLLILDEPTVGVDPVLRKNIWDYLQMLTLKMNLTIIITTQYIEEARSADLVSFMRNGKLMAEKNPIELMEQMNMPTLEDVFLKLSQTENNCTLEQITDQNTNLAKTTIPYERSCFLFFNRIMALNWKNLTSIRRNISMLIIQFLMPSFQCLLNFVCLGPDPYDISVAIYNADSAPLMSRLFINNLNNVTFKLTYHKTFESAIDQVKNGLAWAMIEFQKNYTQMMHYSTSDETIKIPQIGVYLDTTNYVIANTIQKELWFTFNHTMTLAKDLFFEVDSNSSIQENPFDFNIVYGMESPKMSEFMAPGLISMAIFFAAMALTTITLVLERKDGIFERSLAAGVKKIEFIISQISTQFLILAVQVLLSIITMLYIIDIENHGSITLIYIIILIQGMCGMALGLVVSSFSQNESQAVALAMASFLPISIISGIFWPIEAMPNYMKMITYYGPQTMALEAMRSIISRGWNLTKHVVIYGFLAPSIWFILLVIFSSIGFHIMNFG